MNARAPLTAELQHQILASIRAGGYAHVAAQAWGVSPRQWRRWLAVGRRAGAPEPYRSFYRAVQQARAQARLKAEMEALGKDPRFWLKNGPGKDPNEAPGWAAALRRAQAPPQETLSLSALKKFMQEVRALLAPHATLLQQLDGLIDRLAGDAKCPGVATPGP